MAAYQARHLVENTFADRKQFRGIATRYCKLATTYLALVTLAASSSTQETRDEAHHPTSSGPAPLGGPATWTVAVH